METGPVTGPCSLKSHVMKRILHLPF